MVGRHGGRDDVDLARVAPCLLLFLEVLPLELLDFFVGSFDDIAHHTLIALHHSNRFIGIVPASDAVPIPIPGLVCAYLLIFGDEEVSLKYVLHLGRSVRGADVGVTSTAMSTDTDIMSAAPAETALRKLGQQWH